MKLGDIEIKPLAAESLGMRSLCTEVITPDIHLLLDPSAALAKRYKLEPHPVEYVALRDSLKAIRNAAIDADALSISHYHFDHVRPGFPNYTYNLSSRNERKEMFQDKLVFAKDNRERINPSQRRRGFFFEKDVKDVVNRIEWSDGRVFEFGNTMLSFSHPLPHGPTDTRLGYVIAVTIEYSDKRFLFAPDVQGPIDPSTLHYILSIEPDLLIVGGPPVYLSRFSTAEAERALASLITLSSVVQTLVVDHHLLRSSDWQRWLAPVVKSSERSKNQIMTMAELSGLDNLTLEANRNILYEQNPPSEEFIHWTQAADEFKAIHPPPIQGFLE
ncbi:MAG: hypothetical protein ACFFCP_05735 [Promethearchaeota archaeon]